MVVRQEGHIWWHIPKLRLKLPLKVFFAKSGYKIACSKVLHVEAKLFEKKAHYDRFSFFLPICLCCNLSICSTKVSVFKVFGGRYIYSFVCLFAYLCYITLIHLQMTQLGMQILGTYLLCRWVPTGLKSGLSGNLKDVSSFKL